MAHGLQEVCEGCMGGSDCPQRQGSDQEVVLLPLQDVVWTMHEHWGQKTWCKPWHPPRRQGLRLSEAAVSSR